MCNEDPTLLLFRVSHDRPEEVEGLVVRAGGVVHFFQTLLLDKEETLNSSLSSRCDLRTSRLRVSNEGRLKATLDLSHTPPKTFAGRHKCALFLVLIHIEVRPGLLSRHQEEKELASSGGHGV